MLPFNGQQACLGNSPNVIAEMRLRKRKPVDGLPLLQRRLLFEKQELWSRPAAAIRAKLCYQTQRGLLSPQKE